VGNDTTHSKHDCGTRFENNTVRAVSVNIRLLLNLRDNAILASERKVTNDIN
jgi:hypothetical protein